MPTTYAPSRLDTWLLFTRTTTSSVAAAIAAATLTVSLAGCTPTEEPTTIDTPEIQWQSGAPSGEGRYVDAVRAADLGTVLAWNAHDFTIEQLSSTVTPEVAAFYYDLFEPAQRLVFPGPRPSTVIEVAENDAADGAEVVLCRVNEEWKVTVANPQPEVDLTRGTETTYAVVAGKSGTLVVDGVTASGTVCDASAASVGYFWPTPNLPDQLMRSDVRPPIGYVEKQQ